MSTFATIGRLSSLCQSALETFGLRRHLQPNHPHVCLIVTLIHMQNLPCLGLSLDAARYAWKFSLFRTPYRPSASLAATLGAEY